MWACSVPEPGICDPDLRHISADKEFWGREMQEVSAQLPAGKTGHVKGGVSSYLQVPSSCRNIWAASKLADDF